MSPNRDDLWCRFAFTDSRGLGHKINVLSHVLRRVYVKICQLEEEKRSF